MPQNTGNRASVLATPSATAAALAEFGLSPKKCFGQNFLINDDIVKRILRLADVCKSDTVLEIGPGIGTLTCALLAESRCVVAIERDRDLLPVLIQTTRDYKSFSVIENDAMCIGVKDVEDTLKGMGDNGEIPAFPNKLVSNLPYSIAASIVLKAFQEFERMQSATVMVQREVAERMRAKPNTKEYGAYTVKLALYARPVSSFNVGPSNFLPRPHVESSVIRLDRLEDVQKEGGIVVREYASAMADAAFFQRRKTIQNSCRAYFKSRGNTRACAVLNDAFEACGIDPHIRGEALNIESYIALGKAMREFMDVRAEAI